MDYIDLYNKLIINPSIEQQVFKIATEIRKEKKYFEVERDTGVSASLVGAIHQLESGRNFKTHLHNGDPLSRKTRRIPAGRPSGKPPFTWLESAIDAIDYDNLTLSTSKAEQCKSAVKYNGLGYEKYGVVSPYGFSGSQFYKRGKYVSDGRYSSRTVSTQIGVCVILKEIERLDRLNIEPVPVKPLLPVTEGTVVVTNKLGDDITPITSPRGIAPNIISEPPPKIYLPILPMVVPKPIITKFVQPKPFTKISKYLTVGQFTKNGQRKFVSQKHYLACKDLAEALDEVREFYGKRLIITSGIRTLKQNRAAGGVSNSYHVTSCAADVIVSGVSNYRVFDDYNDVWQGGLGRYSNGTTHFDLGSNRRWDWSGRAGLPKTEEESIALIKSLEEQASTVPVQVFGRGKVVLQTKRGEIVIKPNINLYVGDVIIASDISS